MKLPLAEGWEPKPDRYYAGLPMERYHAAPGVGSSYLRTALQHSPWYAQEQAQLERPPTEAQRQGTLFHSVILEPETLERDYLFPERPIDKRTKAGKEEWAALEEEAAATGRILMRERPEDLDRLTRDVHSHPAVRAIWRHEHVVEHAHWWIDGESGLLCKRRPDLEIAAWTEGRGLVVDVKKTQDPRIPAFARSVARYGYGLQAAMYVAGFETLHGYPADFAWVAVGASAPHEVSVLFADPWIAAAHERYRHGLDLIARCERTGDFPRLYGGRAKVLDMPAWAHEITGDQDDE